MILRVLTVKKNTGAASRPCNGTVERILEKGKSKEEFSTGWLCTERRTVEFSSRQMNFEGPAQPERYSSFSQFRARFTRTRPTSSRAVNVRISSRIMLITVAVRWPPRCRRRCLRTEARVVFGASRASRCVPKESASSVNSPRRRGRRRGKKDGALLDGTAARHRPPRPRVTTDSGRNRFIRRFSAPF